MIALASECLLFEMANGESVPLSSEMISVEVTGESAVTFDQEFVKQAAASVFHFFKYEMERKSVTVGEFAEALEKVLRGFDLSTQAPEAQPARQNVLESDLCSLANESGRGCELLFFPKLRDELRSRLAQSPQLVRFRGLRGCVKQLTGARRWTARCQSLNDQIVGFLRDCLSAESNPDSCAVIVE
ncbi:MAG TPA: hypothetical protein VKA67_05980 [Verrucomicrobiae bacterium]|nr:hypothetical protein [Verrucomicrobiae bacterium]